MDNTLFHELAKDMSIEDMLIAWFSAQHLDKNTLALLWIKTLNALDKERREKKDFISVFKPMSETITNAFETQTEQIAKLEAALKSARENNAPIDLEGELKKQKSASAQRSANKRHAPTRIEREAIQSYWSANYKNSQLSNQQLANKLKETFEADSDEIQALRAELQIDRKIIKQQSTYAKYISEFKKELKMTNSWADLNDLNEAFSKITVPEGMFERLIALTQNKK